MSGAPVAHVKPFSKRPWRLALTVVVTVLALAGEAVAQVPDDSSAVDQYVEDVPAAGGSTPVGKDKPKETPLSSGVDQQVEREGGKDATSLRTLATSSRYGAPQMRLKESAEATRSTSAVRNLPEAATDASAREAASAAVDAGGSSGRLLGFLIALFVFSVAAFAAVALQQKRRFSRRARARAE